MEEKLAWMSVVGGQFTVRRAYWFRYHLAQQNKNQGIASTSQQSSVFWNKLWGLNLLPRIATWAWQATHGHQPPQKKSNFACHLFLL